MTIAPGIEIHLLDEDLQLSQETCSCCIHCIPQNGMITMKNTLVKSAILFGTVTAGLVSVAPADAGTFTCPVNVNPAFNTPAKVSGSSACEISTTANQDFLNTNPLTVNGEGFFGITNWVFGGKIGQNAGYTGNGGGQSGTYNFTSAFQSSWNNVMLIFKSGQGTTLTGYLLNPGVTSGTWASPFTEPPFNFPGNGPKDVSHISVYYTTTGTPIPTPALLPGLIAMGAGILRKRKDELVSKVETEA